MAKNLEDRLWIKTQNTEMKNSVEESIKNQFPIEGKKRTIKLKKLNINYNLDALDQKKQRDLKLAGKSWEVPITADLSLVDNETGAQVDSARIKIGNIPMLTERVSVILDGNEYQTINQFRRKSGIYTRIKNNGQLESEFNLAKGYNFKLNMDPEKGIFYLILANKHYEVYGLLKALGVADVDMRSAWGKEIFDANMAAGMNKVESVVMGIYETLTRQKPKNYGEALDGLRAYLEDTEIDPGTTKITLGQSFDRVRPATILASSETVKSTKR